MTRRSEHSNDARTPAARSAAFFDLDRTLIAGSSAFVFARAAREAGLVSAREFLDDALKAVKFRLSGASDDTSHGVRDRILKAVEGVRQSDLEDLNEIVLPQLLGMIRPEARALLEQHRSAGRDTYIVSASPIEIVEPLARALELTGGIGTVGEVIDGAYTGQLTGPFCYGEGKAEAIAELAASRKIDLERSYSYSDSMSDLPMMELVGHPVAVNPDGPLKKIAQQRGWPIVQFSQRTKTAIRQSTSISFVVTGIVLSYVFGKQRGRAGY